MRIFKSQKKTGFTIIEVVLVLAIAGLIFLMVFIALPNLQRTRRDAQRRNDIDRLYESISQYLINNRHFPHTNGGFYNGSVIGAEHSDDITSSTGPNNVGAVWAKFYKNYLLANDSDTFMDPDGVPYNISVRSCDDDLLKADGKTCSLNGYAITDLGNIPYNPEKFQEQKYFVYIMINSKCGEDESVIIANGYRKFTVRYLLEGNGWYCVDNS